MLDDVQIFNRKKTNRTHSGKLAASCAIIGACLCISCASQSVTPTYTASITISNAVLNTVDSRLFGFTLDNSASHQGPELIVNKTTGTLPPEILSAMKGMHIPLVRFPGGAGSDYADWTETINNAPGRPRFRSIYKIREDGRKVGLRFGIDEFGRLKRETGFQAMLVVNVLDALAKKKPVREAAESAAGLIAYCNATDGGRLRKTLRHWPSVRSRNGNPIPFAVEYVQLGSRINDPEFQKQVRDAVPHLSQSELIQWYIDCIGVYIQLIKHADPNIKIIIDADMGAALSQGVLSHPSIQGNIDFVSHYRDLKPLNTDGMTADELWRASVFALVDYDSNTAGEPIIPNDSPVARIPTAYAAWSWNPSQLNITSNQPEFDWRMPAALGCASWLNSLIRRGDTVQMATMDNLLGNNQYTSSIFVSPDEDRKHLYGPQGRVTSLYSRYHGARRLALKAAGIPAFEAPRAGNTAKLTQKLLDITATSSDDSIYLHAVNMSRNKQARVKVSFAGIRTSPTHTMHVIGIAPPQTPNPYERQDSIAEQSRELTAPSGNRSEFIIPPASVAIIDIPLLTAEN